jgi:hypothetical protein
MGDDGLLVFDEVSREVLLIGEDGNQWRSFPLAYPAAESSVALSRIGQLGLAEGGGVWALRSDKAELAAFTRDGILKRSIDLASRLPYPAAAYTKFQWDGDQLFLLEYSQGAILYGDKEAQRFKRLSLAGSSGLSAPEVQDFAIDSAGNLLLLTADSRAVLVTRGNSGQRESIELDLPGSLAGKRLGCRPGGSGFVVWARDGGIVWLCTVN